MKVLVILLALASLQIAGADPSLTPIPDPTGKAPYAERFRIQVDLDGDEVKDMLLSSGPESFGTMGGPWTVYLKRDGSFVRVGEIWAHPGAIAIEADQARIHKDVKTRRLSRIWVYLKASGSAGSFGYYRIGEDSVDKLKSVEIYPGDGGTSLGNAVYEAAFKKSPIPFTIQGSQTGAAGNVNWQGSN